MATSPLDTAAMQHGRFILVFVGICLASYAVLLGMARSPLYCRYSRSYFDTAPCFKAGVSGITADILLVGDSSLLYGVRPDLVAAAGGGTTYNLGMVGPSFAFQVNALIDRYLASNQRPRAIVLYFAPRERISPDVLADPMWAPLGVYLLRHGSWDEIAHFVKIRPSAIVEMPPIILTGLTQPAPRIGAIVAQMQAAGGFLDYARGTAALSQDCQPGALRQPSTGPGDNREALADLRRRFAARGIPLFVYVAPIAICDNAIDRVRQQYRGVSDNIPQALPNTYFANDTPEANHVHASSAGVAALSGALAEFIRTTVQPKLASHA